MIEFKNVTKIYHSKESTDTTALEEISLTLGRKGLVFITGKSGCGKSTFLNLLGNLDTPTTGEIYVEGNNITNWQDQQRSAYRASFVGFVFQEFHLLEEYSVLENITLATEFNREKINETLQNNYLQKLELENLKNHKPSELSGGQKQKVAILRALLKNPKMILADEPTGNLDSKASSEIFEILKEISKEILVVVVSHDIESATLYGDRIIEMESGHIIRDTNPTTDAPLPSFHLKNIHIPFSFILNFAKTNILQKPGKLLLTIILLAFPIILIGILANAVLMNPKQLVLNTLTANQEYTFHLQPYEYKVEDKENYLLSSTFQWHAITEDEAEKVKEQFPDTTFNKTFKLYENNWPLTFEYGDEQIIEDFINSNGGIISEFIEIETDEILTNLIGQSPKTPYELVITQYLADYILNYGVYDNENNLYKPTSYEELINDYHPIKLGINTVYIIGITRNEKYLAAQKVGKFIRDSYKNETANYLKKTVYVKGFTDVVKFDVNKELFYEPSQSFLKPNNTSQSNYLTYQTISEPIEVYTKDGFTTINSLKKEELIISIEELKEIDEFFKKEYQKCTTEEEINTLLETYLKEYTTWQDITFSFYINQFNEVNEANQLHILGITKENHSFISMDYLEEYTPSFKRLTTLTAYENNSQKIKDIIKKTAVVNPMKDTSENGIFFSNIYTKTIDSIAFTYNGIKIITSILALIFILFTIILFYSFISNTITYSKKKIGILRSLGATNKDILKIYCLESFIVSLLSYVIGMIALLIIISIINNNIQEKYFFTINALIMNPLTPIILLIFAILLSTFMTLLAYRKLKKVNPINAILEKEKNE